MKGVNKLVIENGERVLHILKISQSHSGECSIHVINEDVYNLVFTGYGRLSLLGRSKELLIKDPNWSRFFEGNQFFR